MLPVHFATFCEIVFWLELSICLEFQYCLAGALNVFFTRIDWFVYVIVFMVFFKECMPSNIVSQAIL